MKKIIALLVIFSVLCCKKQNDVKSDTAIDSSIQNTSHASLLQSLKEYDADNGFVVIMETNTGKIKSLIGLEKTEGSNYVKSKKVAIDKPIEPGSLIKPFNLMSLLEDKKADTSSVYDAKGGKISFYGSYVKDSH